MVLKSIIVFAVGIYSGIYIDQNYKIPKIDEPSELWRKICEYSQQYVPPSSIPRVDEPKELWRKVQEMMDQYKKPPS